MRAHTGLSRGVGRREEMHVQPEPSQTSGIRTPGEGMLVIDLVFGLVSKSLTTGAAVARPVVWLGRPVSHAVLRPPLVPSALQPATWLGRAARRGVAYRNVVTVDVEDLLDRVIPAVLSQLLRHVDLNHLVKENVDVATLAEEVIAEVDLPAIIRSSTGAVASDTLVGVRMQSITGDEAIGRVMARLRSRLGQGRHARSGPDPQPASSTVLAVSPAPLRSPGAT
jgi:hypothetical protein